MRTFRTLRTVVAATALLACSGGTEKVSGAVAVSSPVEVSSVAAPVTVSSVSSPVAVSGIAGPVTVSGVASPIAVSGIQTPVPLVRPDLDPTRIESGDFTPSSWSGGTGTTCYYNAPCLALADGPFILTDVMYRGSNLLQSVKLFVRSGDPNVYGVNRWEMTLPSGSSGPMNAIVGARLAVRAGEKLYLDYSNGTSMYVTWSGFRP